MSKKNLILLFAIGTVLTVLTLTYINFSQKRISNIPFAEKNISADIPRLAVIAKNLEIPWALVFLNGNQILFTERPGRVRIIDDKGNLDPDPIAIIDDVKQIGEGGLLGITIHPNFSNNNFVYLYYTYSGNGDETLNRVVRFKFENNTFLDKTIIADGIPGAINHNGGRIKFGPDGFLYITTGDSQNPSLAQDKNSLAGKIIRVTDEGKIPSDNPFGNEVFSYGHRNPQGLTWDENGKLWETEHGASTLDELNIIEKEKNYGWPIIRGDQAKEGMETPILNSGSDTWAPSGAAYLNGSIFFAGLRGQALFEYDIENKNLISHLKGEFGRIREVIVGPDSMLYITTSNRDGRGIPDKEDDKIIRVNPGRL